MFTHLKRAGWADLIAGGSVDIEFFSPLHQPLDFLGAPAHRPALDLAERQQQFFLGSANRKGGLECRSRPFVVTVVIEGLRLVDELGAVLPHG